MHGVLGIGLHREAITAVLDACLLTDKDDEAEIWWVHVARSHRGPGIGRRLIDHLIAALPDCIPAVYVTTFKGYIPTLKVYERLGFVPHTEHVYETAEFRIDESRATLPAGAAVPWRARSG